MVPTSATGSPHAQFTKWVKGQGVQIDGITPANIEGRRLGICANRKIEVLLLYNISLTQ